MHLQVFCYSLFVPLAFCGHFVSVHLLTTALLAITSASLCGCSSSFGLWVSRASFAFLSMFLSFVSETASHSCVCGCEHVCLSMNKYTYITYVFMYALHVCVYVCMCMCICMRMCMCAGDLLELWQCMLDVRLRQVTSLSESVRVCQCLSVSVSVCQCLSISVSVCQCLSLSVSVSQCLSFSVSVC